MGNHADKYFEITERGSNFGIEVRSGVVTFMAMCYILVLNPQILAEAGIAPEQTVLSTSLSSGLGCLLCGIFARLPVGVSPVSYLSVYVVYGLIKGQGFTVAEALSCCCVTGIFLGFCAVLRISTFILKLIPRCIKLATVVGMGLLITLFGLDQSEVVVRDPDNFLRLGDLSNKRVWLCFFGLVLVSSLLYHQVRGALFFSVFLLTLICWVFIGNWPQHFVDWPIPIPPADTFLNAFPQRWGAITAVLGMVSVMLFDAAGSLHGMARLANLVRQNGKIPGSMWAFISSAVATILAARLGSTPVLIYIESAAGIREGGRTGISAIITGLLFMASAFFAPLFGAVPSVAVAPVMILLGASMIGESNDIDWNNMKEALPAFLCIIMMPFTFSVPTGIFMGVGMAYAFFITSGEFTEYLPRCLWPWGREPVVTMSQSTRTAQLNQSMGAMGIEMHILSRSRRLESSDGMEHISTASFYDDRGLMRHPTLLVDKNVVDTMDNLQLDAEIKASIERDAAETF